jgi:hypothetical protein
MDNFCFFTVEDFKLTLTQLLISGKDLPQDPSTQGSFNDIVTILLGITGAQQGLKVLSLFMIFFSILFSFPLKQQQRHQVRRH